MIWACNASRLAAWRECSRQALSVNAVRDWSKDHFTDDDPLLIEQIRTRLLPRRGVRVSADDILVTVGAQHALYLVASLLFDQGTVFGIEDPGYTDARKNLFPIYFIFEYRVIAMLNGDGDAA